MVHGNRYFTFMKRKVKERYHKTKLPMKLLNFYSTPYTHGNLKMWISMLICSYCSQLMTYHSLLATYVLAFLFEAVIHVYGLNQFQNCNWKNDWSLELMELKYTMIKSLEIYIYPKILFWHKKSKFFFRQIYLSNRNNL